MFPRIITTRKNGKTYRYLVLIQGYRDGGKVRQKVVGNLGNIDNYSRDEIMRLINLLSLEIGAEARFTQNPVPIRIMNLGAPLAISRVWEELELSRVIEDAQADSGISIDVTPYLEVLVAKYLLEPNSHIDIGEWCRRLYWPEGSPPTDPEGYYQALGVVGRVCPSLERLLPQRLAEAGLLRPPIYEVLISSEFDGADTELDRCYSDSRLANSPFILKYLSSKDGFPLGYRIIRGALKVKRDLFSEDWAALNGPKPIALFDCKLMCKPGLEILRSAEKSYAAVVGRQSCSCLKQYLEKPLDDFTLIDNGLWAYSPIEDEGLIRLVCHSFAKAGRDQQDREVLLDQAMQTLACHKPATQDDICRTLDNYLTEEQQQLITWAASGDGEIVFSRNEEELKERERVDGRFIIESNCLREEQDMINAYWTLVSMEQDFSLIKQIIKPQPLYRYTQSELRGLCCINILSSMILRYLEMKIGATSSEHISGRTALDHLSDLKAVQLSCGEEELVAGSLATDMQLSILKSLGIKDFKNPGANG